MSQAVTNTETQERAVESALRVMRCIECGGSLEFGAMRRGGVLDGLEQGGKLHCRDCGHEYPIVAGSPVMLKDRRQLPQAEVDVRRRTAESFAYEWQHFGELRADWERNFRDYIRPRDPASLKDCLVLDVGAGSGRHSYEAHRNGARVIAVDVSEAIHVARRNLPADIVTVQADAESLPFKDAAFDLVMAIGVLHHLPDPWRAMNSIGRLVRPGGFIHIYVYWIPSYRWHRALIRVVGAARRMTTRTPRPLMRTLSYPIAVVVYATFVVQHRLSRRVKGLERVARAFPLRAYADYPFQVCVNDQFDRFSAPLEWRFTAEEVEALLGDAGFSDIVVLANHGWIGSGRRPREVESLEPTG